MAISDQFYSADSTYAAFAERHDYDGSKAEIAKKACGLCVEFMRSNGCVLDGERPSRADMEARCLDYVREGFRRKSVEEGGTDRRYGFVFLVPIFTAIIYEVVEFFIERLLKNWFAD